MKVRPARTLPAAVFASGGGTNLQALLDHEAEQDAWRVAAVVSDREGAGALERARSAGREAVVVSVSGREPDAVAAETLEHLERWGVGAVLLAGYLRLVPAPVVEAYGRRILNVHPALLPAFGGKGMWGRRVHEAVLASGAKVSGATVHYVDEEYDAGTILAQWPVPVLPDDGPDTLAARVLRVEHLLYPRAADHLCRAVAEGREPGAFRLPGSAFTVSADVPDEALAVLMDRAFGTAGDVS